MLRNHGVKVSVIVAAFGIGVWVGGVRTDAQRAARVLEVRRYTANAGKLDALLQRMREGETKLFEKHGMKGIFYSVAADAPESQNTFIYVLSHPPSDPARILTSRLALTPGTRPRRR